MWIISLQPLFLFIGDFGCGLLSGLKKHIAVVHDGIRKYRCEKCDKAFSQLGNLKKHISCVHEGMKKFRCHICDKSFGQLGSLKAHVCSWGKKELKGFS